MLLFSIAGNITLLYNIYQSRGLDQDLFKKYPLLSYLAVAPSYPNSLLLVNFLPLREQIHAEVDQYADTFAMYFEYLPSGTNIGINEDSEFTAQSLLKVPVVMAYFRMKERVGMQEDKTVQIKKNELNDAFGDLYKKGAGYAINLADAVKLALQKSDNTASLILADQISQEDFTYVYDGLDIPEKVVGKNPIITVQEYSSILKALYDGSILSNDDSEHILELLTHTEFNEMLPSGVSSEIKIAHKIGLVNKEIYEDCGIVYMPMRPYILCMVSKSDRQTAVKRMKNVSHLVYKYIAKLEPGPTN